MKKSFFSIIIALSALGFMSAATGENALPEDSSLDPRLVGKTGYVTLPGGNIELNLNDSFRYLDPEQTKYLLESVWKNPDGSGYLGAMIPVDFGDGRGDDAWAALLSYEDTGHVKDNDAATLNYDDILKQLKDDAAESNKARKEKGFDEVSILGWATPPRYDSRGKTMYWARELKFGNSEIHTLNYEIRLLGRTGVLSMNLVAGLPQLSQVEQATPQLLTQASFVNGQRYADFQEGTDHLAEFGVAGLILGGIALKAGFFKILLGILAAGWKFILIGAAAVGAFLINLFKKRKQNAGTSSGNQSETGSQSSGESQEEASQDPKTDSDPETSPDGNK